MTTTMTVTDTENIVEDLRKGVSLGAMSRKHHLSREVIRQIGERAGLTLKTSDYLAPSQIALTRKVSDTVCAALDDGVVLTTTGLRGSFPTTSSRLVGAAIEQAELIPLLGVPDPPEKIEFTVEAIHAALRAAADQNPGAELTGTIYDRLLKEKTIAGPSRVLIIKRIGSWSEACRQAEVPFRGARREYDSITPGEVWMWLDEYAGDMVETNTAITFGGYSQWAKSHPGAPSGSLIKSRMMVDTSWNQMRDSLILRTYKSTPGYWVRDE